MRSAVNSHVKMAKVSRRVPDTSVQRLRSFHAETANQPVYADMAQERSQVFWTYGRVKKISCLSSPTAPIFLPDRDFFLFFYFEKNWYTRFLVHSIELSKKVVEKESQQVSLSTVSSPLGGPLHAYG